MLTVIATYLALGAVAGILAGLLGVGGGLVIVPMVVFSLQAAGQVDFVQNLGLGTSFATIIFTSISSFRSHHVRGAVLWPAVYRVAPGILIGTFLGAKLTSVLSTGFLQVFFVCFLLYVGTQMLLDIKPKPSRTLPGSAGLCGVGGAIGAVSSLVGIGGGTLSVPFLSWCNIEVHKAIGTSAAIGFPIAIAGALGNVFYGWGQPGLPEYSLGFVYLPAFAGIAAASIFTAPLGAGIAHKLPVRRLKSIFAMLLFVMAAKMIWGLV